jgi:hypothetical protein
MRAVGDGGEHGRVGDRLGVAAALEADLVLVDGAGGVGQQDEFEVDRVPFGRLRRRHGSEKEQGGGEADERAAHGRLLSDDPVLRGG